MAYDLAEAAPEDVGLSSAGLAAVDDWLAGEIAAGRLAGVSTLVARHGRIAHVKTQGLADIDSGRPVAVDDIWRIFSMTKPVTGAAMMMLWDEGRWRPEDPIAQHWPAFQDVKVLAGIDAEGRQMLVEPEHPPTMRELMTHTAGLSYGFTEMPFDQALKAADIWGAASLADFADRVAGCPLAYQPGKAWLYSVSMDIQGAIIERLSGQSLPDFFRTRLFEPLDMADTGFVMAPEKLPRLTTSYRRSTRRGLVPEPRPLLPTDYVTPPKVASGGGGLVSTLHDYARFAQMLLNRGEFGGRRLLSPEGVALMSRNHLPPELMTGGFGIGAMWMRPGFGHGFDCAVFTDPDAAGIPVGKGTFQWDGAAGTWFWVDPANDLIFVGMISRLQAGDWPNPQQTAQKLMAGAIL
jgi:CubicO group peptidase (beta-lactamase class C family)